MVRSEYWQLMRSANRLCSFKTPKASRRSFYVASRKMIAILRTMSVSYESVSRDANSAARRGILKTRHGAVETPVFMPVGTQAAVKSLTPVQVRETGATVVLGNTYHLNLRPGSEVVKAMGGLHTFMGWDGPILTDSGGYQAFSLARLRRISDAGVEFRSHLDGRRVFLGPSECIQIQDELGSDIAMVLDECSPWPCTESAARAAVERTVCWAERCRDAANRCGFFDDGRHLFGIVQGSTWLDLRRECAERIVALDLPGYAVGGVSVGEPEEQMMVQAQAVLELLPADRPRYVMGVGTPPQLLQLIGMGADMFDCVLPTRLARHGTAMTPNGPVNLKNERFKQDPGPIVEGMDNYTCRNFSRAYLRHLVVAGESLAGTLLSIHNLSFYAELMAAARQHIAAGTFLEWSSAWIERYRGGE